MPKIQYLHKTRQGIPDIYAQMFGDILQNMNFSRYYRNRGKFIYGFDPNIFKCSYKHFKKHQHNTHLWAPLVNLAVLCRDTDDSDAYKYTQEASKFLLSKHINQIRTAIVTEDNIPKIIIAVLMVMYNLDFLLPNSREIQDLNTTIKNENSSIIQLYNIQVKGKKLQELFINTAYNCEGKIMLKV